MARRDWSTSNLLRRTSAIVSAAPLSMSIWGKTSDVATVEALIGLYNSGATTHKFICRLAASGQVQVTAQDASATGTTTFGGAAAVADKWFHAGAVFASTTSRTAYQNGVASAGNATSVTPTVDRTSIGLNDNSTPIQPFGNAGIGDLAEAAIWNIALTDRDMVTLATGVNPLQIRPDALIAYWPLIGYASPEIDLRGGLAMTMQGALSASPHPRMIRPKHHDGIAHIGD